MSNEEQIRIEPWECIHNSRGGGVKTITLDTILSKINRNNNQIEDEDISVLYQLFNQTLLKALDLMDKESIELITIANTERTYFSVQGATGFYTLYPHINFCPCYAFKSGVMKKEKVVICKHILACHLSLAMKKYKIRTTSDFVYNH